MDAILEELGSSLAEIAEAEPRMWLPLAQGVVAFFEGRGVSKRALTGLLNGDLTTCDGYCDGD